MSHRKIGIAGYMGSGKSLCAKYFSCHYGGRIINADQVAKDIMNRDGSVKHRISEKFGSKIIQNDCIQFSILGKIVFQNNKNLEILNSIVYPVLKKQMFSLIAEFTDENCFFDAALISQWHIEDWFDTLVWVDSSEEFRLDRLIQRTGLSSGEIMRRMQNQKKLFKKPEYNKWICITNDETKSSLEKKIMKTVELLKGF